MGERKVLNKYFGPDFDPEKIPRKKRLKNDQFVVRMMLPMSIRCKACGEYMYKGKKFNSRRENVEGEDYLGIKIIRFYMNCTNCRAEFCIKTDPKNEDYVAEAGAHRNYEPWRDREAAVEAAHTQRAEEDDADAMKRLENRTKDSKMEMDALDALDELRTMNSRNNAANIDEIIARKREQQAEVERAREDGGQGPPERAGGAPAGLDEADEAAVQRAFGQSGKRIRRMDDSDEDDGGGALLGRATEPPAASAAPAPQPPPQPARAGAGLAVRPAIRVTPKAAATAAAAPPGAQPPPGQAAGAAAAASGPAAPAAGAGPSGAALLRLGDYGSSSDSASQ